MYATVPQVQRKPEAIEQLLALGYKPGDQIFGRLFTKGAESLGLYPINFSIQLSSRNYSITRYTSWKRGFQPLETITDGIDWLTTQNERGYNVYYVVNVGGPRDADITSATAAFFEIDDLPFKQQAKRVENFGLAPTLVIKTRKSLHTYYSLSLRSPNLNEWRKLQRSLAMSLDSDPAIENPSRLMRLAGFQHQTWNPRMESFESVPVTILYRGNNSYSLDCVIAATKKHLPFGVSDDRWMYWKRLKTKKARGESVDPTVVRQLPERLIQAAIAPKVFSGYTDQRSFSHVEKSSFDIRDYLNYLEGVATSRRDGWATAKCPVHNGVSYDSLHIHLGTGSFKCHAGCDSKEITKFVLSKQFSK